MLDRKRREKIVQSLEKMKKAELIEYAIQKQEEYMKQSIELYQALAEIESLEEKLREIKKNDRGAGRKEKFNDEQVQHILKARKEGKSIRVIAKEFNCSAGLVHKLIKSREEELKNN